MKLTVSTTDLCEMTGLCLDSVQKMVQRPSFPDAIVPTGDPNGRRVWLVEDVQDWFRDQRGKLPKVRAKRRLAA